MSTKDIQAQLVSCMRSWQAIENTSVGSAGRVLERSSNPLVRTVMEIIQRDSMMHHRVQGMIADSLSVKGRAVSLTPDELGEIWDMIENHSAIEQKTIEFANDALKSIKGKKMILQEFLLNYLLADEEKHNRMLNELQSIKRSMYPYS